MKKVLLTGSTGFIGKNILESYLSQKYEISSPTRLDMDLLDENSVNKYFKNKEFDVILHTAAKPAHRNAVYTNGIHNLNLKIFETLVNQMDKYKKFINFGSGAIYDLSKNITDANEEDILKCPPQNDFSKYKVEVYKRIQDLDGFIDLNIFGIFGKYEDYAIRFISNAICKTLFDLPITIKQNRRFSYLYIEDLMPILEFFIENPPEYKSYNIVPDEKIELLEIARIIKDLTKTDSEIIVKNEGYGLDYTGSNKRLKNELTNVNFTDIKISIERLYNWYSETKNLVNKEFLLTDK